MNRWKRPYITAAFLWCLLCLSSAIAQQAERNKGNDAAPAQKSGEEKKAEAKGDPEKGKQVFADNCALCHNADSDEAIIGPGLKGLFHWPPHKLSDGTEHKEHTVAIIRKQIVEGGGAMAAVGASFSEEEINNLIAYLQTL